MPQPLGTGLGLQIFAITDCSFPRRSGSLSRRIAFRDWGLAIVIVEPERTQVEASQLRVSSGSCALSRVGLQMANVSFDSAMAKYSSDSSRSLVCLAFIENRQSPPRLYSPGNRSPKQYRNND